jgi:hypothetical protein
MAITLKDKMKGLSASRRRKIEARTDELVKEQTGRRSSSRALPKSSRRRVPPAVGMPAHKRSAVVPSMNQHLKLAIPAPTQTN